MMRKTLFTTAAVLGLALAAPAMAQSTTAPTNNNAGVRLGYGEVAPAYENGPGYSSNSLASPHYGVTVPNQQDGMDVGQDGNR